MKKILGLDLGTSSIGWALVNEADVTEEKSSIIKLGVRVNPITVDELTNFEKGKSITTNADRTLKRSMRRNLQRYKLRRENLIKVLRENKIISTDTLLSEQDNRSTFDTYRLRAKAVKEEISLEQFGRVLLMINKKRGYRSSRKARSEDEGQLIDSMEIAKRLYDEDITPGYLVLQLLKAGTKYIPDFYRSDLQTEFDKIWEFQKKYFSEILTDDFKTQISGKGKLNTSRIFLGKFGIYTAENKGRDKRTQAYQWRNDALKRQLQKEELAFVISDLNGIISSSSGYLGSISDRSKELYFKKLTVGQYLMTMLERDPHTSLRNLVFYRQDYLDEFNTIWENQVKYHPELNPELKAEIRDIIVFFQRRLKSQKGLISFCEFERREIEVETEGRKKIKTTGSKVCPKSSPLYQEFKIWQIINNIEIIEKTSGIRRFLEPEEKELLFTELQFKRRLLKADALRLLFMNYEKLDINFEEIEGNRTQASLYEAYFKIVELSGHGEYNFSRMTSVEIRNVIKPVFESLGYDTSILTFDAELEGRAFEKQSMYRLWHLLYSFEGDNSKTGNEKLIKKISETYGFEKDYSRILTNVILQPDYGSLSSKAIRKILPYLKEGNNFSVACEYAGYRHSKSSLTREEIKNKKLRTKLDLLKKNSLRNPVVEKILNQMINVVNTIIDTYGKPDEIRIELARELKKSAKEREELSEIISKSTNENEKYRSLLQNEFGILQVSRNDIIRYRLYLELAERGYKTLYSNTYIPKEKLFSKEFDIEHIIPQSRLFDDSFSNKVLECRSINIEKGNDTAYDFVLARYGEDGLSDYLNRIEELFQSVPDKKTKLRKLKMKGNEIPDNFVARDLRDTQYIAKKAKTILEELVGNVVSTSGLITDRLREDWQLVDVMRELNWNKYDAIGMTETIDNKDGHKTRKIKGWTKRNDHRHHAMDALTIAFTKNSFIQYLNNLNARSDKAGSIYGIEAKELYRDDKGKLRFKPPLPLDDFRVEAKKHLENTLISIKAKNKVVTVNVNTIEKKGGTYKKRQLTPRGQLHLETVYGSSQHYVTKEEKVGAGFNDEKIATVSKQSFRIALFNRLKEFGGNPKKAFTGKNSLEKNPLFIDDLRTLKVPVKVRTVCTETIYTVRKNISPDLKIEKVVDEKMKDLLIARLNEFNGDPKKAFSNLDENPIWQNKDKGIAVKRVTVTGVSNAIPLHEKRDKEGKIILDRDGRTVAVDFVNTGNNHHAAIYRDKDGNLQENVISFFEAVARVNNGLPVVDKDFRRSEGWEFLFSMKQNEYFIFPDEKSGFSPADVDLSDSDNYALISPNLFRVQKIATKDYFFRHHLETNVEDINVLKGITWLRGGLGLLKGVVKVRVNHIGKIVFVGEY